jgi:hypothetical protein
MELDKQQGAGRQTAWKRGLFVLFFMLAFSIAHPLLNLLAVVQFLWLLFAGAPNEFLLRFGRSMSVWLADAARFLACATEEMPFPWKAWPDAG